ncbi:ParB/RepB/Spo0J family partition protein [Streptomyces sp. NPDC059378]|uniref:ParB/RepB/Spo0J family partition protein n=1 Tax=Streptomyces sp. NPDC059378 TaxID=3346815 RepID=UPI00369D9A7D
MSNEEEADDGRHDGEEWVPIASLLPADSPRLAGESAEHIQVLALSETVLPPIVVHVPTRRVIDGMHRLRAARLRGQRDILVRFHDGDDEDAFIVAVETNIAHGLPLSQADRTAAAARIVHARPQWSDRKVASVTGLSATTVGAIRRRSAEGSGRADVTARVGRDGRVRPLDATAGRLRAGDLLAQRPDAPIREIAVAAGVSPATALDVRRRLRNGEHLVPERPGPSRPERAGTPGRRERQDGQDQQDRQDGQDQQDHDTPGPDWRKALFEMKSDPSIRFTDGGRALLRWLHGHTAALDEWREHMASLPPHSLRIMARLAQHNSATWQEVQRYLEDRILKSGS